MSDGRAAILIVDDEEAIHHALARTFRREACDVLHAHDAGEAAAILGERPDVKAIVCDHYMPGMPGLAFLLELRRTHPDLVTILLTAQADVGMVIAAMDEGRIHRFFTKPWDADELRQAVREALGVTTGGRTTPKDPERIRSAQLERAMGPQTPDDDAWIPVPSEPTPGRR
jgi:DNA-binding NtrC family response regulator